MIELEYFVALLLFITECFHAFGHQNVFFRIRLLPRVDVVRIRFYFLFESLSVFVSSYLFLQRLQWLTTISIVVHGYYVLYWDKTAFFQKIVSWTSLDWIVSIHKEEWHIDTILWFFQFFGTSCR